ncbi:MAG: PilX N-terminal domain-containing pilus assembly protein [Thermodesulfobacteriota bacterium]|jgi:cytoskeletal protein CcmA (bactofilin family)
MSPLKQQKGAALVGVMMVLLVLTLLGSTAFLTSHTELNISSNYNQSLQATYAAEAGLQQLLSYYRQNPGDFLQKKTGQEMNFPIMEPEDLKSTGIKFWINALRYDPQDVPTYAEVIMVGKDSSSNGLSRVRATIYCAQSGGPMDVPSVFKMGIVTAGQLNLSGQLEIFGNLHANRGYSIEPSSIIEQHKQNQFPVTQSLDSMRPDYLAPLEVPIISEKKFQDYRSMAQQSANQILFGQQSLVLSGDQKGLLIFVEGDLILTGNDLSGLTIVTTGSITLNGSTSLNGNHSLDTVFIAGRDIGLNDFSQIAGVFWSNGTVKKTGAGKLMGTVVCQGSIVQSGGLHFERVSQISNAFLSQTPTTYAFSLTGWSQM